MGVLSTQAGSCEQARKSATHYVIGDPSSNLDPVADTVTIYHVDHSNGTANARTRDQSLLFLNNKALLSFGTPVPDHSQEDVFSRSP